MNKGTPNKPAYETGEVRVGITAPDTTWIKADGSAVSSSTPLGSKLYNAQYYVWTTQQSQFGTSFIWSVAYGNGLWVAGGDFGTLRTSTDAITWVTRESRFGASNITSVAYGNSLWVAGGDSGTLRTSTDAINWVTRTSQFGAYTIYSVAYGNSLWVAGGEGGVLRTSTDAVSWVTQISQFGGTGISSIAYGNGLWVAAGGGLSGSGTALRTLDSTKSLLPSIFFGNNIWGWIKK